MPDRRPWPDEATVRAAQQHRSGGSPVPPSWLLVLAVLVYIYAFPSGPARRSSPASVGSPSHSGRAGPTVNTGSFIRRLRRRWPARRQHRPATARRPRSQTDLGTSCSRSTTESAPVAAENFINLADAGFYNGLTSIASCRASSSRAAIRTATAAAGRATPSRTSRSSATTRAASSPWREPAQPNSAGSQFFIVLDDSVQISLPESGGYVIFGNVTSGMDVVDQIAADAELRRREWQPGARPGGMNTVTIQPRPIAAASASYTSARRRLRRPGLPESH